MESNSAPLDKLKQQLAQLDRLVAEGVLKGEAARRSRDELERQVLAAVLGKAPAAAPGGDAAPAVRPPRRLLAGVGLFVLAFGLAGYAWHGNRAGWAVGPGEPGAAAASEEAAAPHATSAEIEAMIARLAERLKTQPDDANGWSMLARSYTAQGKYKEALEGYKRVVELRPKDAQALADYADGLAVLNNRSLEGEPEKLIMQAVKLDPANVKALALAGTISFNKSEYKAAADYWGRAMQASEPGSEFSKQLQGALDEARQRAGLAPAPAPLLADGAPGAPQGDAAPAATGDPKAAISGRVTLSDAAKAKVAPDDVVFIYARAPTGSRMPLAILRKKVSDLPLDFRLDDSLAMSPAARLSGASQVVVGVRVSKTGNAMAQPGDLESLSAPMAVGASGLHIEIGANPR